MKNLFYLLIGILFVVGSAYLFLQSPAGNLANTLRIGGTVVEVEITSTQAEHAKGLSGRTELAEGTGMLFVFESPRIASFWMKDMNFPIDIIWIGEDWRVAGVERSVVPETYPENFSPSVPVKYVLEVPAGFSDRHNIDMGTEVYFN